MTNNRNERSEHPAASETYRPPRRARRSFGWLAVVLAAAGLVAVKLRFASVPVITHVVARGPVAAEVMGTGTLEARLDATISPKIQGRLAALFADQGDRVKAGQRLAQLDDAEWKEQVAIAQAGLDAARATIERVRADETRAQAVLHQAQLNHHRALDLRQASVSAQSDLDKALENLRVAEADLKRAQAGITEAERQRVTAEKNLSYHQARLADTQLMSPFDGLVVRRDRDPGDVVVPGASVLRLISTHELWISAWVDETAVAGLAIAQPARVVFRADPTNTYPGEVARVGQEADRETRELVVDVRVSALPPNWAVGQRAEVYIATARKPEALLAPRAFISWRDGQPGGYVAIGGRARWARLQLGLASPESVEILGGLKEGDRLVRLDAPGPASLNDGTRIRPR